MKTDNRFIIDPTRCVEIFGEFNDEMASHALRETNRLRLVSNDPITVFINSIGGSTRVLAIIDGSLNNLDQAGQCPQVITVASGNAFSSAAILLTYGDYATAHPHSLIHFHGVRYDEYTVTAEKAADASQRLQRTNREIARKLANRMIMRLIHRYINSEKEFIRKRQKVRDAPMLALEYFVAHIKHKVSNDVADLLDVTLAQVRNARHFTRVIIPKIAFGKRLSAISRDAKLLNELVKYEIKIRAGTNWMLDDDGRNKLMADYSLLWDYHFGPHRHYIDNRVKECGSAVLTTAQFKKYVKIPPDKEKRRVKFLDKYARPKIIPFWFFAMKLSHNLLAGENQLAPYEAYWIGIIDEVVGNKKLSGWRELFHPKQGQPATGSNITPQQAPLPSQAPTVHPGVPTAPSPPASQSPTAVLS